MAVLIDYEGRAIRLTDDRWKHISGHPEMAGMRGALEETLRAPEVVRESVRSRCKTQFRLRSGHGFNRAEQVTP